VLKVTKNETEMHENTYNNKKNKNDKYSNETKNIHTNYNKTTSAARVTT